jgi:hypothetical protein
VSRISKRAARWTTLLLALAATQCVRFENRVAVSWDGGNLAVASHDNRITRQIAGPLLAGATSLHASMAGETVLAAYTLDAPSGRVAIHEPPVFYAFGRDWTGNAIRATAPGFVPSFGDWTMDRHRTPAQPLQTPLPPRFTLTASFLGRGEKSLLFTTPSGTISVNVRDGFLDNDVSICDAMRQCTAERSREPVARNLLRVLSTVLEALVLGGFLLLVGDLATRRRTGP